MSRYFAYVGSYTDTNDCKGLTCYEIDPKENTLTKREEYEVSNSSYLSVSHDRRFLYSTTDLGVVAFAIQPDGSLKKLNQAPIKGMRGCHICLTPENDYMFVSGYYDGKVTVLKIKEDGSVGKITCSIFHRGPGSVAERNFRPHCRCARLSPDGNYLLVADSGLDQIRIYRFDRKKGTLTSYENIHCKQQTAPCFIRFSRDGRFFYCIEELANNISTYSFEMKEGGPECRLMDSDSTIEKRFSDISAAVHFRFLHEDRYLLCANAGENSAGLFRRDPETGALTLIRVLPISGRYPTSVGIFPDEHHFFVTNFDSNSISFMKLNLKEGLFTMYHQSIKVMQPNCSVVVEVQG